MEILKPCTQQPVHPMVKPKSNPTKPMQLPELTLTHYYRNSWNPRTQDEAVTATGTETGTVLVIHLQHPREPTTTESPSRTAGPMGSPTISSTTVAPAEERKKATRMLLHSPLAWEEAMRSASQPVAIGTIAIETTETEGALNYVVIN